MAPSSRSPRPAGSALVLLAACAGTPEPEAPAPRVDYPTGICMEAAEGLSSDAAVAITSAEDALERGCPREAMLRLAASAPASTADEAWVVLLAAEADLDALSAGFDRWAPPVLGVADLREDWMGPERDLVETVRLLSRAVDAGLLPAEVRDDGRLATLVVRSAGAPSCLDSLRDTRPLVEMSRRVRDDLVGRYASMRSPGPAVGREAARYAMWECAIPEAVELEERAAEAFEAVGRVADAREARLRAIERAHFPGGRAGDLLVAEMSPAERNALAGLRQAAGEGAGPLRELGRGLEAALGSLVAAGDAAGRARTALVQSAGALLLGADPARARDLALSGMREAATARRADLVDSLGVLLLVASVETGDEETAREIGRALDRSFAARGVPGLRLHVAETIENLATVDTLRGETARSITLLRAAAPVASGLPPFERVRFGAAIPRLLGEVGRFEEALAETDHLIGEVDAVRATNPGPVVEQAATLLRINKALFLHALGRDEEALEHQETEIPEGWREVRLWRAVSAGDDRPVGEQIANRAAEPWIRQGLAVSLMKMGFCAPAADLGHAALDELIALAEPMAHVDPGALGSEEAAVRRGTAAALAPAFGQAAALCGADTGDADLVRKGERLERALSLVPGGIDPLREATFEAALLDAEGRHGEAAERWQEIGRAWLDRTGIDAASGIGAAQYASFFLGRAALSSLRASPPGVEDAIALVEESRARDLRAARVLSQAGSRGSPTENVLRTERALAGAQGRLRSLVGLRETATNPGVREGLSRSIARAEANVARIRAEHERAILEVRDERPDAYRAAALAPPPALDAIRSRLGPDEALVYFIVEPTHAFGVVVDSSSARVASLRAAGRDGMPLLRNRLFRHRTLLAEQLGSGRGGGFAGEEARAARGEIARVRGELYDLLVRPLERWLPEGRRVLLVPDALTADLPFAALGPPDRPWALRNPLRVLPGAALLDVDAGARPGRDALVLGDPVFAAGGGGTSRGGAAGVSWRRLPGTRSEATEVAGILGTRALLGAEATEARLRERAPRASVLHIASHGLADRSRPAYSAIVLATPEGGADAREDGILHAFEVERLRLDAGLVVLSACETGRGQPRGTEGVLALDRAFLVAGAGAVLSSLWVVDDRSTEALMRSFYRALAEGVPADVALARAMADVRARTGWEDPWFWAGFRLVGGGLR